MTEFISPTYFTHVAQAALRVAKQDETDESYLGAPSNAVKLKFDITRMAHSLV